MERYTDIYTTNNIMECSYRNGNGSAILRQKFDMSLSGKKTTRNLESMVCELSNSVRELSPNTALDLRS